jgi:predicted GNAT family N-acyltransferase
MEILNKHRYKLGNIQQTAFHALRTFESIYGPLLKDNKETSLHYSAATDLADFKKVISLRKKIFLHEEGYPPGLIWNKDDREKIHFIAWDRKKAIGTVSVDLDKERSREFLYNCCSHVRKRLSYLGDIAMIQKLAVLPEYRKTHASLSLMVIAYEFIKQCKYRHILIYTLTDRKKNIELYKKFGFKEISVFDLFDSQKAVFMALNILRDSYYEKLVKKKGRLNNLLQKIYSKFFIDEIFVKASSLSQR